MGIETRQQFEFYQTLVKNPMYTNEEPEEVIPGYKSGGYVAIIAENKRVPMKLSDKLYSGTIDLWETAADKPFVREMATGTLDEDLFRNYMLQDYLYLLDYIDILKLIQDQSEEQEMQGFLQQVINETENETYRVHVPHMKRIGINDEETSACMRLPAITEYVDYMKRQVKERGLIAGLTALLQCSWVYAYIGKKMISEHADEIYSSPYKFWFEAYTCREYLDANQMWIDILDRETSSISSEEAAELSQIFRKCAEYENRLWDALYQKDLSVFDGKYVRILDIYGDTITGCASYGSREFLECEWGGEEDGLFIEDILIYNSQIRTIEEIVPHGTAELRSEHLVLRKYRADDAEQLYKYLGTDPDMDKYSGWNPYATLEMAQETVQRFIESYDDEHSYSWVMDANGDDVVAGTIGAYEYKDDRIEVGFSVIRGWRGRGFATEALKIVLEYLTENEGISCVTAWCAAENISSRKVLEKAGMQLVSTEKNGLAVRGREYDKLVFEYWKNGSSNL